MLPIARVLSLAVLTAGFASSATLTFTGANLSLGIGTVNGGAAWMGQDGANFNAYFVGGMDINVDGYTRTVFCIDAFTDIYIGSVNDTLLTVPDSERVMRAAWVLTSEYADLTTPHVDATSSELGAAMQLAIWDIIHDGGDGLGAGRITASTDPSNPTNAAVLIYAQQFLSSSFGQSTTNAIVYNNFCTGGVPASYCGVPSQTLLGLAATDPGPQGQTPEPASMALVGAGVLALAMLRRKQR